MELIQQMRTIDENLPIIVFIDTWGWYALADINDSQHQKVNQIINFLSEFKIHLFTTDFILDETYTLVRSRIHHEASLLIHKEIEILSDGKLLKIFHVTTEVQQTAWKIFERYSDKAFSFTDCTSFAIMRSMEITHVLTNDHHFRQMGFSIMP